MASLTKVLEIRANTSDDHTFDIFVCDTCREDFSHTVVEVPETKDGVCEWRDHV